MNEIIVKHAHACAIIVYISNYENRRKSIFVTKKMSGHSKYGHNTYIFAFTYAHAEANVGNEHRTCAHKPLKKNKKNEEKHRIYNNL